MTGEGCKASIDETEARRAVAVTNGAAAANSPQISPEMRIKLAELYSRVQARVGQVVLAMMNLPRYKTQALGDLAHLVIEPLLRDRVAIASVSDENRSESGPGDQGTAGIAIWASVSDEVDAKIREQIKDGAFPTRLQPDDWTSGDKLRLLAFIAPKPPTRHRGAG